MPPKSKGRWTIPAASSIVSGSPGIEPRVARISHALLPPALCRCCSRPAFSPSHSLTPLRADIADIRKSVVRVTTTSQNADYKVPWNPGNIERGIGAGFIIAGPRIITNAHVISNSRFRHRRARERPEEVCGHGQIRRPRLRPRGARRGGPRVLQGLETSGNRRDSAIGIQRVRLRLPHRRRTLERHAGHRLAHRFPDVYTHSSVDSHLACQIDAAINPGQFRRAGAPERQGRRRGLSRGTAATWRKTSAT